MGICHGTSRRRRRSRRFSFSLPIKYGLPALKVSFEEMFHSVCCRLDYIVRCMCCWACVLYLCIALLMAVIVSKKNYPCNNNADT